MHEEEVDMVRQVVVTGAASGIGKALAAILTDRGDRVIGVDLHDVDVVADLSTPEGRAEAVAGVLDRTDGVLAAAVACAGVSLPSTQTVAVNYFGVVDVMEALRPALARAEQPRGAVIASISSTQPFVDEIVEACADHDEARALALSQEQVEQGRGRILYSTSKVALARWMRRTCIAPGWADAGIPLNAVGPGVVRTPMIAELESSPEGIELMNKSVPMPLHGWAEPAAAAHALAYLVSPENTHVTGQLLFVDGGADATTRGETAY
ncbi:MAG: SDR family oxidoreductase [Nocardioides sp.]|nr:SDR family oxidoreductase [Nocardioides sp.]